MSSEKSGKFKRPDPLLDVSPEKTGKFKRPDPLPDVSPQKAGNFKRPALDLDDLGSGMDDNNQVPDESNSNVGDALLASGDEESPMTTPRCPMCHKPVDRDLLMQYANGGRMNIRKQTAFCKTHHRKTALEMWKDKYPKIKWETLTRRFERHSEDLRQVLEGAQSSHYRDILQQKVDAGKDRTIAKTDESNIPGYYGPRGLRLMTDFIADKLSDAFRTRAVMDRLVAARSYNGYIEKVLVPELAVRLIKEDMEVGEEDARKILRESAEFGELVHEEAGDVVGT